MSVRAGRVRVAARAWRRDGKSSSRVERRKDILNAGDEKHEENEVQDPGPQTNTASQRLNAQWMRADRTTPTPTRTCTCVHAMNICRHLRPQPPTSAAPRAKKTVTAPPCLIALPTRAPPHPCAFIRRFFVCGSEGCV
ncbi:hypothetical protein B0H14DRAFT_3894726 [Mycena olivaceomarginata]|nr:hypothetical protein B0H14DRAFT_3894726 [Mycena olivaceomarginata]